MVMKIDTCRDCPDRRVGCHGVCERYREARRALDEANERTAAARAGMYGVIDSRRNNRAFRKNRRQKHG